MFIDEVAPPDDQVPAMPSMEISQEELQMAITLTEYFQAQRQAYDKVHLAFQW